jgi:hypothetical protein
MRTNGGPRTTFEVGPELAQKKPSAAPNSNFLYALYGGKKIRVGYQVGKPNRDRDMGKVRELQCTPGGVWIDIEDIRLGD